MNSLTLQNAVRILVLAVLYFVTGRLGLMLPASGSHITLIWLPTGIAVAMLLTSGFRCWPGVAMGAMAVNVATGVHWPAAMGIAAGNTAGALLAAWIVRRMCLHPAFDRRRDILILAGGAAVGTLVSAGCGVAMLSLSGDLAGGRLVAGLIWWAGDTMGIITAAPLLLSLSKVEWRMVASRPVESFVCICTIGIVAFAVFFVPAEMAGKMWLPAFVTLPLLAWAAMRFGTAGASVAILMLTAMAAAATSTGHGPFLRADPTERALVLWLFMATCAMLGWVIAALHTGRLNAVALKNTSVEFANTAQKRAEEALRVAGQKLRLHFEQTPMATIEWDLEFRVTEWNPAARTIFGFSREEAIGQHASFIVPEEFRPHVNRVWEALLKIVGGERSSNENVRKDGTTIQCEWYNTPLVDRQGKVIGVASLVMDITERKQAQQLLAWEKSAMELIGSPAALRDVLEGLVQGLEKQAPGGLYSILQLDDDGIHLRRGAAPSLPDAYNRAIDGIAIGPAVGSCGTAVYGDRQVIVSDIASDPLWAAFKELALAHGLRACWSTPIRGSQGKTLGTVAIYYREPRNPLDTELDLIARAANIIRIAIERKRAEEALRESEEKFRTLFENAGDAILLLRGEKFVDCNARTLEMFGCADRAQIVGHPPYEFSPPLQPSGQDSAGCAIEKITAALAGRPQFFEWMHTKLDGTPFPAEVTLNIVTLGGQVLLQAVVRDISERKRAEAEIRMLNADLERRVHERTAELQAANEEMSAFSYSVSHDLRAPLRAIDGFSRIVVKNQGPKLDDDGRRMLDMIRAGAQRMAQLIDDLLAFSRLGRQALEPVLIDMHAMAQAVFDELAALEPGRKLRLTLHPIPAASGTQAMIRQVWVNLIANAIKFTGGREVGEIEIGVGSGESGERIYSVKDNGAGFDMRHAKRLFGVFQRLHAAEEFEGTGVGLALVQRIVQRHGGRVWAESEVGRGATFSFTLAGPHR